MVRTWSPFCESMSLTVTGSLLVFPVSLMRFHADYELHYPRLSSACRSGSATPNVGIKGAWSCGGTTRPTRRTHTINYAYVGSRGPDRITRTAANPRRSRRYEPP